MKALLFATALFLAIDQSSFAGTINEDTSLYSEPSTDSPVTEKMNEGLGVTILDPPTAVHRPHGWIYVQNQTTSQEGWVETDNVTVDDREQIVFDEKTRDDLRIYFLLGAPHSLNGPTYTTPEIRLGLDYSNRHWIVGGYFGGAGIRSEGLTMSRSDADISFGYQIIPKRLYLKALLGTSSYSYGGDSAGTWNKGFDLGYRYRFSRHWDFGIDLVGQQFGSVTITHDTGVPATASGLGNAFCTILTFGLSNGCGDQTTQTHVQQSSVLMLNFSVGYVVLD